MKLERPALLLAAGYHKAYKARIDSVIAVYVAKRAFLGITLRRQKRQFVEATSRIP